MGWPGWSRVIPVAPRVATDTLMPGPSEGPASANQRPGTGASDQLEAELTQAAVEHRHWCTLATMITFRAGVTRTDLRLRAA